MKNITNDIHKRTNRYIDINLALELNIEADVKLHIELDELFYHYMTIKLYSQLSRRLLSREVMDYLKEK